MIGDGALLNFKMIKKNKIIHSHLTIIFYCLSFLIPALSFFIYFACHHFDILTVDLGQQYVDFFAFLRRNLFTHPARLIYSFQNGLGGSMIGTDAYYLLSPFNLIFFFFSQNLLPFAILLIISLKIGTAGLTSYYYWQNKGNHFNALAASLAYSLSGYVIANHFNLMWLDSVYLLPLLIKAIADVLNKRKSHLLLITFLLWLTNFYTGLMALFFGFLYFLSKFIIDKNKDKAILGSYLKKSILASFSAAFVLLPTFFEMLAGKANSSANWSFSWQFNPFNELSKLSVGAYNFTEMQTGMPNIYFTLAFTLITLLYFMSHKFTLKQKISNACLLLFLLLSLCFTPLVLLWHLGQFPIWYPARFSFVLIFFCLDLAMQFLDSKDQILLWQKILLAILGLALIIFWYVKEKQFAFLNETSLILSTLFVVLALLYIAFVHNLININKYFLIIIVLLETITNLILSLNNLSYQKNSDYQKFAQNMNQVTSSLNKKDHGFYRLEKNFYRSDDDSFTGNYNGLASFNSTTSAAVLTYLSKLGYLHNSNSVTNDGATPISDALLGIKYYVVPNYDNMVKAKARMRYDNVNNRQDIFNGLSQNFKQLTLIHNQNALPIIALTTYPLSSIKLHTDEPLQNQEAVLKQILHSKSNFIRDLIWPDSHLINASGYPGGWRQYNQKKAFKKSMVTFVLSLKNNRSYYLELPDGLDENEASLFINHKQVSLEVRDDQNHLINIGTGAPGKKAYLAFVLKQKHLDLNAANLWSIDTQLLNKKIKQFKQKQPKFRQTSSLTLSSNVFTTKRKQTLVSSIPYSPNWLLFDQHHLLVKQKYNHTFLKTVLPAGKHQLKLVYLPFTLLIGILLSLVSLVIIIKDYY